MITWIIIIESTWITTIHINIHKNYSFSSTTMNPMSSSIEYSIDLIKPSIIHHEYRLTNHNNSVKNHRNVHTINHNNILDDLCDEWCENGLKRRRIYQPRVSSFSSSSHTSRRPQIWWEGRPPNTSIYTRLRLKWGVF